MAGEVGCVLPRRARQAGDAAALLPRRDVVRPAPRRPPLRLLPPPSCAPGRRCLMLTLVDGTAVTQCMLHTMDVEPAEPILMDSHTPVRAPPSPRPRHVSRGARTARATAAQVRIVIKSDALHDGIAELEWGGDTGARACASAASSPPHPPTSATTSASGCRPQRCGVPLSQLAAPSTETCVRCASGAQKDKRLCLRVALDPPQLSLTAPGRRRRLSPHWTVAHPRPLRCEQVSSVDLGCEMAYPPESLVHFEVRGGSGGAAAFWAEPDGALSARNRRPRSLSSTIASRSSISRCAPSASRTRRASRSTRKARGPRRECGTSRGELPCRL